METEARELSGSSGPKASMYNAEGQAAALGMGTERVRRVWAYILPLSITFCGLLLTQFSQTYVQRQQQMQEIAGFERVADHLTDRFDTIVRQQEDLLVGVRGLFSASNHVSRLEYDQFMSSVDLPARFPAAYAIAWTPKILDADVERYEVQVAVDRSVNPAGYLGFKIRPPSQNAERFPVTYIAPDKGLERGPLGIDLGASDVRRMGITGAIDSGLLSATAVFDLLGLQKKSDDPTGFLMALALYETPMPETLEQRRQQFRGAIVGAFRISTLLSEAGVSDMTGVALYDVTDGAVVSGQSPFYTLGTVDSSFSSIVRTKDVANRMWEIRYFKSPEALQVWSDSSAKSIVLVLGIILSLISGLLLHVLITSRNRALSLAHSLTADLTQVNADLTRSNHDLSQFAYVASHDLQTPVRNVQTTITLLEGTLKSVDDPAAEIYMDYLRRSAQRMQRLVGDLLDYARTERLELDLVELDLGDVLNQTLERLSDKVKETSAQVNVDKMPTILGEADQLERVFSNIIMNALTYVHPDRRPVVNVNVSLSNNSWAVAIEDNGVGIEEQHFKRIFEPFQRLHRHDEIAGTGLGLSICKEIVERHGGSLLLSSVKGEGSVFTLYFPNPQPMLKAA